MVSVSHFQFTNEPLVPMLRKDFEQTYLMPPFPCGTTDCQQLLSNVPKNITSKVSIKKYIY